MKPIPLLATDLIAELDAAYPCRPPRIDAPDRKVWWDAGQRELIDHLKLRLAKADDGKLLNKER
jgi:hypothetical protein